WCRSGSGKEAILYRARRTAEGPPDERDWPLEDIPNDYLEFLNMRPLTVGADACQVKQREGNAVELLLPATKSPRGTTVRKGLVFTPQPRGNQPDEYRVFSHSLYDADGKLLRRACPANPGARRP